MDKRRPNTMMDVGMRHLVKWKKGKKEFCDRRELEQRRNSGRTTLASQMTLAEKQFCGRGESVNAITSTNAETRSFRREKKRWKVIDEGQ